MDCVFSTAVKLLVGSGRTRQFTINIMNDFEKLILSFLCGPHDVKCGKSSPANNNVIYVVFIENILFSDKELGVDF